MQEITRDTVARAAKGDQYAIETLYTLTYNDVYKSAKFLLQDEDTALDIVQDSYVTAFQSLGQLEDPENFRPWIRRVATNNAKDYLKRKKPVLFSEMAADDGGEIDFLDERPEHYPEVVLDRKETSRLVKEILGTLGEDQRLVIGMYYYEQMSVKEIAEALGCSENTVKSRLNYGRKKVEIKVRDLEKKGTRLYALAPLPFLISLLALEASAAEVPSATVLAAVTAECAATGTAAASAAAGAGAKAAAGAGVKSALATKIAAGALAVAVAGGTVAAVATSGREKEYTREEVLAAYQEVSTFDERQWSRKQEKYSILHPKAVVLANEYDRGLLYCDLDLDGNGTDELLIGEYDPHQPNFQELLCVYTFDGEKAILAFPADPHSLVEDPGHPFDIRITLVPGNYIFQSWGDHNTQNDYSDFYVLCQISPDGFTPEAAEVFVADPLTDEMIFGDQRLSSFEFGMKYLNFINNTLHWEVLVPPRQFPFQRSDELQVGDTIPPFPAETAAPTMPDVPEEELFDWLIGDIRETLTISDAEYDSDPEVYDALYAHLGEGVIWLLTHRGSVQVMSVWVTEKDIDGDGQAELCIGRGVDAGDVDPIAIYYQDGRVIFGDALYAYWDLLSGEGAVEWDYVGG